MEEKQPLLAITMGDPTGIGPEITVKALSELRIYEVCRPLVIGDCRVMKDASENITGLNLEIRRVEDESFSNIQFQRGRIDVIDLDNVDITGLIHGRVSAMAGKASFEYIKRAIELALQKRVDATVTGPIHKEAINLAGFHYSGHTEIYADFTRTKNYAMMLVSGSFRVIHVSTHVSLHEAIARVKKERILAVINLAHSTLLRLGIARPKIAVSGLNPHASDGGLFGCEEEKEILPAVQEAAAKSMDVEGPLPPDTCFAKTKGGQYDIAVAMYHDQGHIPLKMAGFIWNEAQQKWADISGINVTLGLPIIRTSVDHGVAFGKAGKGTASAASMIAAIELASELSG